MNPSLIRRAADLELQRLAYPIAQSQQAAQPSTSWWPFQSAPVQAPNLLTLPPNKLITALKARTLAETDTQILNTVERIYALLTPIESDKPSPNCSEMPTLDLHTSDATTAPSSHNDHLGDPLRHIDILEDARQELLKFQSAEALDLANILLKRKVRFIAQEIENTPAGPLRYTLEAALKDDLNELFEILLNEDANRAATIYKNLELDWTNNGLIPTPERNFNAIVPDSNAYYKSLMDREQQLELKSAFLARCILHHGNLWDLFEDAPLPMQKALHEEQYYLLCRSVTAFEELLRERNPSAKAEDSFVDLGAIALDSKDEEDQKTLSNATTCIFDKLTTLHELTGRMRGEKLIHSDANPISLPTQHQPRYISPEEQRDLQLYEKISEKNVLANFINQNPAADAALITRVEDRYAELLDEIIDLVRSELADDAASSSNIPTSCSSSVIVDPSNVDAELWNEYRGYIREKNALLQRIQQRRGFNQDPAQLQNSSLWRQEFWGRILLAKSKDPAKAEMQLAFEKSISKKEIEILQLESETNIARYNELLVAKINFHSAILQRIIDKMGEYTETEANLMTAPESDETREKLSNIHRYKTALQAAFEQQLALYQKIPQPQRDVWEMFQHQLQNEMRDYLTLGLYGAERYIAPDEFVTKFRYAEAGYNFHKALQLWSEWKGNDPLKILSTLVHEFLDWADNNPRDAARLASDVLLTISIFNGHGTIDTLTRQVNAKIFVTSVLGTMSKDTSEKPITREHLKFRALADMARLAPRTSAGVVAIREAASKLVQGNLLGALWEGISTYANEGYKASAIQRGVDSLTHDTAQVARVAFALMRGDSMQQIVTSQAMIELITLVGNIRRAYQSPGAIMREAIRNLAAPFREFWNATGGAPERISRLAALTITVITPSVLVGASMFTATVGGIFVAAIAAVVSSVFLMNLYVAKIHRLVNWVWRETPRVLNEQRILEAHRDEINDLVDQFMNELRRKGVIQDAIEPVQHPEADAVANRFYEQAVARLEAGNADTLREIVQSFVNETNVQALTNHILQSTEGRRLSPEQFDQFAKIVIEKATDRLIALWLYPKMQSKVERECIERLQESSPNSQTLDNLRSEREQALQQLTLQATNPIPEVQLAATEFDGVKRRLVEITRKQ
jgi:hypothetical protein